MGHIAVKGVKPECRQIKGQSQSVRVQKGHTAEMHNFLSYGVNFGFAAAFDIAYIGCCLFILE